MITIASTNPDAGRCQYCGNWHGTKCPMVKAYEYYPDGTIKRVEFLTYADYPPQIVPEKRLKLED